ncbi:MAG: hypothetical protein CMQ19_01660 [Gammaproteobacteria bacterium]|nr:hypothetical protein [Gammaproteobacteria bacterium]
MTSRHHDPVDYYLRLDDEEIHLNPHIGSHIKLSYSGKITCVNCERVTKKSFSQGYCYPCFKKLAQCDLCLVSPERCHFEAGTCRDEEFAKSFCMSQHLVYLANSSGIKVGITRQENLPTRWIDQGAAQALPILAVETRLQSGLVEVACKNHVSDKTHWQRMLKSEPDKVNLLEVRDELLREISADLDTLRDRYGSLAIQPLPTAEVQTFNFPVQQYPAKVASLNFDKTPVVEGMLEGIKGQYLILDIGVINLRKFTSYEVEFTSLDDQNAATSQLPLL